MYRVVTQKKYKTKCVKKIARRKIKTAVVNLVVALTATLMCVQTSNAEIRQLWIHNKHTKETKKITFKQNGEYLESGLKQLNHLLRDFRRNEVKKMDPKLFDLLWEVYKKSGSKKPINVVSGYRSPQTNEMLRRKGHGVARESQHIHGKAIDFSLSDVSAKKLRELGLQAHQGGVGYYSGSFVHLDTGSVRHWPSMSRKQLAKVFPKGRTTHLPRDRKPMEGYQVAAANLRRGLNYDGTKKQTIFTPAIQTAFQGDPFVTETQIVTAAVATQQSIIPALPRLRPYEQQEQIQEQVIVTAQAQTATAQAQTVTAQAQTEESTFETLAVPVTRPQPTYQTALVSTPAPTAAEIALNQQVNTKIEIEYTPTTKRPDTYTFTLVSLVDDNQKTHKGELKLGDLGGERVKDWALANSTRRGPFAALTAPDYKQNLLKPLPNAVYSNGFTKNLPTIKTGQFAPKNHIRIAFAQFQKDG